MTRSHQLIHRSDASADPGRPWLVRILGILAVLGLVAAPIHAGQGPGQGTTGPTLVLSNGQATIDELVVGDDLFAGLTGATPGQTYQLTLLDEANGKVAEETVRADAGGRVDPVLLWASSGVVGCDAGSNPDLLSYRFARFQQAEQVLGGRTFRVTAAAAGELGVAAFAALPLAADESVPRYYFSDGSGCPRTLLEDVEDLYRSGLHVAGPISLTAFLVEAQAQWQVGMALTDVRGGPQTIQVAGGSSTFTELLWVGAATQGGAYQGFVRTGTDPNPVLQPGDDGTWNGGGDRGPEGGDLVIKPWDCPDCPDGLQGP